MSEEQRRCGYPTDAEEGCGTSFGLCEDCGWCWTHCPHREEERTAARRRGAQKTNRPNGTLPPGETPPPPETLEDAVLWCAWAGHAVVTGDLDTGRANAAARLLKEFRQALERSESRAKLEEIRREILEAAAEGDADLEVLG